MEVRAAVAAASTAPAVAAACATRPADPRVARRVSRPQAAAHCGAASEPDRPEPCRRRSSLRRRRPNRCRPLPPLALRRGSAAVAAASTTFSPGTESPRRRAEDGHRAAEEAARARATHPAVAVAVAGPRRFSTATVGASAPCRPVWSARAGEAVQPTRATEAAEAEARRRRTTPGPVAGEAVAGSTCVSREAAADPEERAGRAASSSLRRRTTEAVAAPKRLSMIF